MTLVQREKWIPPKSPHNLIQESLFEDPWQLLIATIFLNKTKGNQAMPIFHDFILRWPLPQSILKASEEEIADLMQPLGLSQRRAKVIKRFTCNLHKFS